MMRPVGSRCNSAFRVDDPRCRTVRCRSSRVRPIGLVNVPGTSSRPMRSTAAVIAFRAHAGPVTSTSTSASTGRARRPVPPGWQVPDGHDDGLGALSGFAAAGVNGVDGSCGQVTWSRKPRLRAVVSDAACRTHPAGVASRSPGCRRRCGRGVFLGRYAPHPDGSVWAGASVRPCLDASHRRRPVARTEKRRPKNASTCSYGLEAKRWTQVSRKCRREPRSATRRPPRTTRRWR